MRRGIGLAVVLAGAGVLAAASPAGAQPAQVVAPRVSRTGVCDGVLIVGYDAVTLGHRSTWQPLMDDGTTRLEVHDAAGRSGPGGRWTAVATVSGGEHVLRWAGLRAAVEHGAQIDLVRVVTDGYRSTGYPAQEPCA